ncbi:transglycosylase family protein [Mycobacterium sp. 852002-51057_SCH5723018]|uniref:transglycosylase family protein n=1 Tax=Mycobacterium sp. 852002-51057_SCH5723018 TaxID=1834094 RepID=UPI0026F46937|nr:transglycosylase family protein [Mycobacterium sp. 852002-51057_SCH5723018]
MSTGNGFAGGLQFTSSTWHANGGAAGVSTGAKASGTAAGGGTLGSKPTGAAGGASGAGAGGTSGANPAGGTFGSKPIGSALAVADGTVTSVPVIAARMSVLRTFFKFLPFAVRAPKQAHGSGLGCLIGAE